MSEIREACIASAPTPARTRLTTSHLLALMIPLAAYFAAFAQLTRFRYGYFFATSWEVHPVGVASELVLLAVSGFVIAAFRKATFPEMIIQMTTTAVLLQTMVLAVQSHHVITLLALGLFLTVVSPLWLKRMVPVRNRANRSVHHLLMESVAAGVANLALIALAMTPSVGCCGLPLTVALATTY